MSQKPLFDVPGENPVFSVGEFLDFVNEVLGARDAQVQGEIVGAKNHPTGFYFSLKDPEQPALMDCYLSPYAYRGLGFALEDGMVARVSGIGYMYKPKGRFSFRVETVALAGEGSLKKAYEALKRALQEEGLFDRKRPLPEFASRIGLITSRTGAVIDDFRRNLLPLGMIVRHTDARMEGARAVPDIRRALEYWNTHAKDIDVLVLIRGGGSMEDLQAFNDVAVVRGVFGMRVPTVVSIGHDRDVPLAQLVADASGSTPTAAAHCINQTWGPLTEQLPRLARNLAHGYDTALAATSADVDAFGHRLVTHLSRISGAGDLLAQRLMSGLDRIGARIIGLQDTVAGYGRHLDASNPERLLRLGYSVVTDETGGVVRTAGQLRQGQRVHTQLAHGGFTGIVDDIAK